MNNKDAFPTIEQSLKMIEEKLKTQKEKKGKKENIIKNCFSKCWNMFFISNLI